MTNDAQRGDPQAPRVRPRRGRGARAGRAGESGRRQIWACGQGTDAALATDHAVASRPHARLAALRRPVPSLRARRHQAPAGDGGEHRRPAPDRQAPAPWWRLRLHRRRRRGRADDACQPRQRSPTIGFRPRVLRDVSAVDTSEPCSAQTIPLPLVLAPTGFTRIADPQGELAVARAASGPACRTRCRRSRHARSRRSPPPTATAAAGSRSTSGRTRACCATWSTAAAAAGYEALVITVDTANLGRRERDVRRGFELPPKLGLGTILDGAVHPSWTWRFVRAEPIRFANIASSSAATDQPEGSSAVNLAETFATQFDARLSWDDVEWFRSVWNGPIVIKGIQTVEDAQDRRRRRGRRGRPVEPRRPATRRRPGSARPSRPGRRRGWRASRDHLRRRCAPGQRHHQGGCPRGHGVHGRPGLPLWTRRRRRARSRQGPRPVRRRRSPDDGVARRDADQ